MGYGSVQSRLSKRQTSAAKVRDLLVILDSSGSIGASSYSTAKTELGKLLALLCPRPNPFDNTNPAYQQVAMIAFSTTSVEVFDFKANRNVQAIKDAISKAPYLSASTCTDLAFKQAMDMFKTFKGRQCFVVIYFHLFEIEICQAIIFIN